MAIRNKIICNPGTGQQITFLQTGKDTGGKLLEMESAFNPHSKEPPPHYHPHQVEDFEVLSGELTVRIDGQLKIMTAGDTLHIPENKVHSMWNNADQKAVVNWKVRPAMETEIFLETAMGLAKDGKLHKSTMPGLLQVALMANRFSGVFRLSKPTYVIQKLLFITLTPFAWMLGFRPVYKKYID